MNGLWKRRIPALLLALVMIVSLMPAALAEELEDGEPAPQEEVQAASSEGEGTGNPDNSQGGGSGNTPGGDTPETPDPPQHVHKEQTIRTEPTCTTPGSETVICQECGQTLKGPTEIPAKGHDYKWVETKATCTVTGRRDGACTVCGATTTEQIDIDPTAHDWDSWKIVKDPTCGAKGTQQRICKNNSGHTETKEIDATGKHTDANNDGKCDVCGTNVHLTHSFATGWTSDANQHWHACTLSGCTERSGVANHSDAKNNSTNANTPDGLCDVCGYRISTVSTYTVTFQYLNSSGNTTSSTQRVAQNGYPTNPATPSAVTISGTTYSFYCWSLYTGSPWYVYKSQSSTPSTTPSGNRVTGNVTYYALYTSRTTTDITLTAAAGKSVDFDITDFRTAYRTQYSGDPSYVTFSVSRSSYENFPGAVYSGSTELTRSDLVDSDGFAYSSRELGNLSFYADKNAKNNSTLDISYTVYGGSSYRNQVTGTLTLKVGSGGTSSKGDINYEVAPGKSVDFKAKDFRDLLQDEYSKATVDYVVFSRPASSAFDNGTLYYDRNGSGELKLTRTNISGYKFYYSPSKNDYDLDELTFTAGTGFKDEITLEFTVYGESRSQYVDGTLVITSTSKSSKGDINYEVGPGKSVEIKALDFRKVLRNEYDSSSTVDYVQFKRPSSTSIFDNVTIYYDKSGSGEVKLTRSNLTSYKFYYSPGRNDYDLDSLTITAGSSFSGEISLDFTIYGTGRNEEVDGTLVISSTSSSGSNSSKGDIRYKVTPGSTVDLKALDFRTFLRDEYDTTSIVDYVAFKKPSSTTVFNNCTLYYDRNGSDQITLTRSNLSTYKFYYSPGRNDYDLDDLTFAADSAFKDSVTLEFTVYGTGRNEELDGTVVFYTDAASNPAAASSYVGSIRYNTVTGTNVQINADEISRYLQQSLPGYSLQYVTLRGVPSAGSLYYNYYSASKYGSSTRLQLTSTNCTGMSFYFNPSDNGQYALTELTYVPTSGNYCASIPFTAYATTSLTVSGTILISVTQKAVSEVYGVTPKNTAVNFPANSIYNAVLSATGSALYSIQLLKLPASSAGTVYVGSGTGVKAATNVQYTYASGTNSISQLRFVPTSTFTGSVEIPYVALNSTGTALASGVFSLGVVNSVKTFKDVGSSVWCYKYVAELSDAKVISGYEDGSFKPDSTLSYGAALKLVMLAAGYPEQAPTGKNVFSGYLDKARADGLVTRSNVNLSGPITRLQVAQLAASALKLNTSNLSTVKPFTDTSDLHVQALNAAGIVGGYFSNGVSTYRPNNSLTRAQMSAIVWRMRNYRNS